MKSTFDHASESFKRLNPHLFAVGAVEARRTEQAPVRPLERGVKKRKACKGGVAVRVHLHAQRRHLLDDDNAIFACKPLRDAIAESLGLDDADKRIAWEYSQSETKGSEGVIVKIETPNNQT